MREGTQTDSELGALVYELTGLVGPQRTIAMLVHLLEEVRDSGAFPRGLDLDIDGIRAGAEELVLMDIAQSLAPRRW
jgi:hypothetical protein